MKSRIFVGRKDVRGGWRRRQSFSSQRGVPFMPDNLIDLKTLLVERPDCDAGTVQQLRNALAQGGTQYRSLRDVTEALKRKLEAAPPNQARTWHLKIGIASF